MFALIPGWREVDGNVEVRLQMTHHRQAKRQQAIELRDLLPRLPAIGGRCQFLERKLQIDNQAETLEAMARRVQTEKEQFIFRRKLPATLSMEDSGTYPQQRTLHIKVERQRILHVVVQFNPRGLPIPGAMVVVALARNKSDRSKNGLSSREINTGNQQVEIPATTQRSRPIEPFCKKRSLERHNPDVALPKRTQHSLQLGVPIERRHRGVAFYLVEPGRNFRRDCGLLASHASSRQGQDVFLFGQRQHCRPLRFVDNAINTLPA